jgi:multicomponent Na+:H+ antiporter subunit D
VLLAAMLMWRQSGDTSLAQLPFLLLTKDPSALRAASLLALFGLLPLLAGAPGYGRWMRTVKAAPGLAGLAAVLLVLAGGVALLRLLPGSLLLPAVPGLGAASLWAAVIVLWGGALAAWRADDLRGRAGWLTVAQAGYLLLAIAGAADPDAHPAFLQAAALHIALAPLGLLAIWLATLTVLARARGDTLAGLSGLFGRMPLSGLAWLVGGLSLVGLPPLAGFREQSLLLSAVAAERSWALLAALLAADVLIAYVVLDSFRRVFLRGQPPPDVRRSSLALQLPLLLTTLALVVAGVWSGPWQRWADLAYRTVLTLRPTP